MNVLILRAPINCNRQKLNDYFNFNYGAEFKNIEHVEEEIVNFLNDEMDADDETVETEFAYYGIDEICAKINDEMLNDQDYWYIPIKVKEA